MLASGGNTSFTAVIVPGASHGLSVVQTAKGHPFRRAASTRFIETLVDWVSKQARSG
jgi:hypothetical protein